MKIDILYSRIRRRAKVSILALLEFLQQEKIDNIEEILIAEGIKLVVDSYTDMGMKVPDKAYQATAKDIVKCLNKINNRMQDQIRKSQS